MLLNCILYIFCFWFCVCFLARAAPAMRGSRKGSRQQKQQYCSSIGREVVVWCSVELRCCLSCFFCFFYFVYPTHISKILYLITPAFGLWCFGGKGVNIKELKEYKQLIILIYNLARSYGDKNSSISCADKQKTQKLQQSKIAGVKLGERETRKINQFAVLEGGASCCSGTFVVVVEIKIT